MTPHLEPIPPPAIEPGVPMPARCTGQQLHIIRTTLDALNIGDSFLVPFSRKAYGRIFSHARRLTPKRFTTRKTDQGLRVWRTA
jgi:hypothetical protein